MMRLRVSSIAPSLTKDKLLEIFEEYGGVESIKVFRTLDNASVALALIEMKREREGEAALAALNGQLISGTRLKVEYSQDMVRHSGIKSKAALLDDEEEEEEEEETPVVIWKDPALVGKTADGVAEEDADLDLDEDADLDDDDEEDEEEYDDDDEDDDDEDGEPRKISLDELDEEI